MKGLRVADTAKALKVTTRTLSRYVDRGCPVSRGERGEKLFDLDAVEQWRVANGLTGRAGRPSRSRATRVRARKLPTPFAPLPPPAPAALEAAVARAAVARAAKAAKRQHARAEPAAPTCAPASADLAALSGLDPEAIRRAVATRALTDAEREYLADLMDVTKQRVTAADASKREISNQERRRELIERAGVLEAYAVIARELRAASEALQRQFGRDAFDLLDAAISAASLVLERAVGDETITDLADVLT